MKTLRDAIFRRLSVSLVAFAAGLGISAISAAPISNGFWSVDLSAHAISPEQPVARQLSVLPDGEFDSDGVPFLAGMPVAVTGIETARIGDYFPDRVSGIRIGQAVRRIHLLHTTMFTDKDGTPLANLVFHYANGSESYRLGYGVHARSWVTPRLEKREEVFDGNSRLAWSEPDEQRESALRLFHTAIENPRPGEVVTSLDIVSLFNHATPLIAALTVEGPGSTLPPSKTFALRKAMRDLRERPDSAWRRDLTVRAQDESGMPIPNATATLSITDDKESFYFGSAALDAQGTARLSYPPPHTVGVSLWVHAPGRMPVVIAESKTNGMKISGEYTVTLKRGATIGGVVKDGNGNGIAAARVVIYRATRLSPHHYSRMDYDLAITRADGRWWSDSLPADLAGLAFEVSHPEFRAAMFATEGYALSANSKGAVSSSFTSTRRLTGAVVETVTARRGPGASRGSMTLLATNALLTGSAELTLQPAILIAGTALDPQGRPLTNVPVIFQQNNSSTERQQWLTDANGRFRAVASAPGSGTLRLVIPGQSPKTMMVNIIENMPPLELKLSPPQTLRGRVVDRQRRPVPGARVRLDDWQGGGDLVRFSALTDESGAFTWTNAPTDQVTFYVTKTNYSSSRSSFGGFNGEVTIQLTRQAGVYGKVFDAETKKPIETFQIVPGRKYSSSERRIRWDRSDGMRGFGGEYSLRLSSYYFEPEARVMVEAPGYEPQVSPAFNGVDAYVHDFALKRGQGIVGIVLAPDGSPAAGAALVLIQKGESAYMDDTGQVRASGVGGDLVRSDAQGRFEISPKLEPDRLYVTHELGFAETSVPDSVANKTIKLQKWGRITGVMRVGEKGGTDATVRLTSNYEIVADADGSASGFSFSLKADPESDGNFLFQKVPPGEHQLALEYRFKDDRYGEPPWSHGFFVIVKSGETIEATLGGTGRRIAGRVNIEGGNHSDVDWKRDVHRFVLELPPLPGQPVNNRALTPQNVERLTIPGGLAFAGQRMDSAAMRERQRAERAYVLLFDTNGVFHADNVPPGKYQLMLNVTDPEDESYNRRTIGSTMKEITVPDAKEAELNAPMDIGAVDLTIRPRLRIGRTVPSFEGKTQDGKTNKLSAFRGKPMLLYFWGLSIGYNSTDFSVLKELQKNYGESGKLTILSCNLDPPGNNSQQFARSQGFTWQQIYLGQWDQTPVPGMFGLNGSSGGVFIDAEGRLASKTMRGTNLRSIVNEAMAE